MVASSARDRLRLALVPGETVSVVQDTGVKIACESGLVWLTVAGEAGDVLLRAGQERALGDGGRHLVVQALGGPAIVRVS